MPSAPDPRPGRNPLLLYAVIGAGLLLALIVWGNYAMRGARLPSGSDPTPGPTGTAAAAVSPPPGMAPPTGTPGPLTPGQSATLVVRVDQVGADSTLTGTILTAGLGGAYTATDRHIHIDHSRVGSIVMGDKSDLRPGALLQVTGTVATSTSSSTPRIEASQLVNLTGVLPTRS
jgi:hypothetical protein